MHLVTSTELFDQSKMSKRLKDRILRTNTVHFLKSKENEVLGKDKDR